MFIVLLRFAKNREKAAQFMTDHNEWIRRGFDDGVFILVGSLQEGTGGGIIAHNTSRGDLRKRLDDDPFVVENIVSIEVIEISPKKYDERLGFLFR